MRTNISYILNAATELSNVFPDEFTYMKIDIEVKFNITVESFIVNESFLMFLGCYQRKNQDSLRREHKIYW